MIAAYILPRNPAMGAYKMKTTVAVLCAFFGAALPALLLDLSVALAQQASTRNGSDQDAGGSTRAGGTPYGTAKGVDVPSDKAIQDKAQEVSAEGTALLSRVQQMYAESIDRSRSPKVVGRLGRMRSQIAAEVSKTQSLRSLVASAIRSKDRGQIANHYQDILVKEQKFRRWEKDLNRAVSGSGNDSILTDTESKLQVRVDKGAVQAKKAFAQDDAVPLAGVGGSSSVISSPSSFGGGDIGGGFSPAAVPPPASPVL